MGYWSLYDSSDKPYFKFFLILSYHHDNQFSPASISHQPHSVFRLCAANAKPVSSAFMQPFDLTVHHRPLANNYSGVTPCRIPSSWCFFNLFIGMEPFGAF